MASSVSSAVEGKITLVQKKRLLPLPGEVLVKEGQEVEPDTPVAKISLRPGIPWVIPVARLIGVKDSELSECMLKKVGDEVKVKEIIARGKAGGIYGTKELESPTDGIIEDISDRSGRVVIREVFGKEEPPVDFDVAFDLGCRPRDLERFMIAKVGDEVKRGEIIAKKGDAAAYYTRTSKAPVSGIITDINYQTGFVTISRPFKEVVVSAYLKGRVASIIPQRGAVIEVPAVRLTGIFGVGHERHGVLKVLVDGPGDVLEPDMIPEDCEGQILVGGSLATNKAIERALKAGAAGLITGTASYLNVVESLQVKLGVGITGQEDIDMTLILMEGFGKLDMRQDVFETLKALEGCLACINGATQIRAGAIRPEIIVPFPEYTGEFAETEVFYEDLQEGLRVRVINEPYFGRKGRILELPRQPQVIESEAKVPVAVVELDDGEKVVVPRANVEIL
ncbi:MAG TPA: hypothetical protein DGR79_01645 [Clostridiales bacterium]|nr:hypothetical protein [Clostridiales bacterium]